jgi:hypothetical protein
MALVDPNIALSFKGVQLQDPLEQYGRFAAIQNAQNQNALAQYQLGAAQRTEAREVARMNELAQAGSDETKIGNALLRAGDIKGYMDFQKSLSERQTQELTRRKTLGEIELQPGQKAKQQQDLADARLKQARQFLDTIDPTDPKAAEQYMAWHEANHADPVLGPMLASRGITAEQSRAQIQQAIAQGPQAFADLINKSKLGTERFMELNKPTVTAQNLGGTTRLVQTPGLGGTATVVQGGTATVTPTQAQLMADARDRERIANENKRIQQDAERLALEGRRVVVAEQQAKQQADPEFQRRMEEAKTVGRKAAEGDVAARQALPKIINRAEEGLRLIDELVGKQAIKDTKGNVIQKGTAPHPGFKGAVGATWVPGLRFVPGTSEASFMSRFDQIKGASFLEAFESLKGGGAITEKEGAKGTDAINRMSIAQSEDEFITAARDLQEVIRKGVMTAQRRVQMSSPPTSSSSGGQADPLGIR